jgi:AbrB family looped-hinge helix DNA binding protein
MKSMKSQSDKRGYSKVHCFYGTATVGERGQIVIPAEAREELGFQAGDKLLVMKHPLHAGLMVFKIEAAQEFLAEVQASFDSLKEHVGEKEVAAK